MQRIRTVKPELFKHDGLFDAEQESGLPLRVAFIGLLTCCDREGRFKWRPRTLKLDVLPYDDVDFEDVLEEFVNRGFVRKYSVSGELYGLVPSFTKHQAVNIREAQSSLPAPEDCEENPFADLHMQTYAENSYRQNHAHPWKNVTRALRETIFDRDGRKCVRCGATESLAVDHIFPKSIGGTLALTNLRTLCKSCNSRRPVHGNALIEDLAKDGLTLEDMQRICMHVQGTDTHEGKGKELEGKGTGREQVAAVASTTATKKRAEPNPLNCETWEAYSSAYLLRYEVGPMRNAKTNGQIAQLVKRLGANAPHVAAWYVSHNKSWYVQHSHSLDSLVKDAEGLYTQWATNHQVTESQARSADRLGNAYHLLNSIKFDDSEPF